MGAIERDRFYLRDPATVAVGARDTFLFTGGARHSIATAPDPPRLSRLLQHLAAPTSGQDLFDTSGAAELALLSRLVADGVILEATSPQQLVAARDRVFRENRGYHFEAGPVRCGHLVLAMTGSVIAGLMAPIILSLAYSRFHEKLDLICTRSARNFVQPELFEYYGIRTWTDEFAHRDGVTVPHIELAKSADLIVVTPASARSIARLASGECSDLLSLVVAATRTPVVVAPTMNTAMWDQPSIRRNVDQLRSDGCYVMEPTIFFEAAELIRGAEPGYGMAGAFWAGPAGLMDALGAVLDHHAGVPMTGPAVATPAP